MHESFRTAAAAIMFSVLFTLVCFRVASAGIGYEDNRIGDGRPDLSPGWGLHDSVAVAGKLFEYRIVERQQQQQRDATPDGSGEGETADRLRVYQLSDDGETSRDLPDWMYYDQSTGTIQGVASHELIGKDFRILVETRGQTDDTKSTDQFNIKVIDDKMDSSYRWSSRPRPVVQEPTDGGIAPVRCLTGSPTTTATVVLDADDASMLPRDRVRLIRDVAEHFRLPASFVRLRPSPEDRPLLDFSSALAAGPGDSPALPRHQGVLVEWDVGCGNVRVELMPSLELLETTAADGRLGRSARQPVVGWHITNRRRKSTRRDPKHVPRRVYVRPTATPDMISVIRPTARPDFYTSVVYPVEMTSFPAWPTASWPAASVLPTRSRDVDVVIEATVTLTSVPVAATATTTMTSPVTPSRVVDVLPTSIPEEEEDEDYTDVYYEWTESPDTTEDYEPWEPETTTLQPSTPVIRTTRTRPTPTTKLPTTTTTTTTPRPSTTTLKSTRRPPRPSIRPTENQPPYVKNPIGRLEVAVGNVLWFVIPINTFMDPEDGGTDNLTLVFMTFDNHGNTVTVPPNSWIQLNGVSKTLLGMPMESDVGKQSYILAAVDSSGKIVNSPFEVDVEEGKPLDNISHEFGVTLDLNYKEFLYKVERRIEVASKIASAFGDSDPGKITVLRIAEGSVKYAWTNNTLPAGDSCPEKEINELSDRLVDPETGSPTEEFVAAMQPYPVVGVTVTKTGPCAEPTKKPDDVPLSPTVPDEGEPIEVRKGGIGDSSLLFLLIIIAAIVLGLLFIILIIICIVCCCRSRRAAEKQRRQREEELSCANKGIPVIFADELAEQEEEDEEAKTQGNSPMDTPASTLKRRLVPDDDEGKPAVPPPEYPRSDPASRTSTLKSDYKAPLLSSDDEDTAMENGRADVGGGGVGSGDTLPPYRQSS